MTERRKRKLKKSWLESYRDYIIKQESPDLFHFWVGATLIATALKRNVCIDRGAYTVLPNLYCFLIAKSGRCRKSAAMEIGLDLVQKIADLNIVHGRATVEGLIDAMDKASVGPDGRVRPDGSMMIHADELSYLFGRASYITDLMTFLTAAYTGRASLDFLTRGHGLKKVRNPCPTLMAGSTPEQMGEIFPSLSLASGFMARCLLIYSADYKRVAKPKLDKAMEDSLIHDLGCISQLGGTAQLTDTADKMFDTWYENMPPPQYSELESFYERKHDHVLKTALILSVSESDDLIITKSHLERALMAVENIENNIPTAISHIGATQQSNVADIIEAIVLANTEPMSHSVLLRRVYKRLTNGAAEFMAIIEGLKQAERIRESVTDRGTYYTIGKAMQDYFTKKRR